MSHGSLKLLYTFTQFPLVPNAGERRKKKNNLYALSKSIRFHAQATPLRFLDMQKRKNVSIFILLFVEE